ncbi:MAG: dihydrolipoyl dehydrogenase, partial [Sphingomonadales bacterium]
KALLRSAELYHLMQNAGDFGLSANEITFDLEKIVKRSRDIAGQLNRGVKHLLKKNKVTVIEGEARLKAAGEVLVRAGGKPEVLLRAKNVIIATGARPRELDHLKADGKQICTYKEAMTPETLPKSLLVIGSGAIGMEFASFYRDLGAEVTVVEVLDSILPVEDAEISALAAKSFERQGMTLLTSATVTRLVTGKAGVVATIEPRDAKAGKNLKQTFERVILAIGIEGNTEDLGLGGLGVEVARGHIQTDEWGATAVKGVWAIGDVTGPPWLAHKASHEGVITVERIAGIEGLHPLDKSNIPGCTYCRPQIASLGMTEEAAKKAGRKVRIGRFPYLANGKAIALGETEGLVKTIFDAKTGELLGAHMIGAEVTELIQGYAIARALETTEAELMHTVFPHPTLSEMMHESVLSAFGRPLHI